MSFTAQLAAGVRQLRVNDPKLAVVIDRVGPCQLRPHGDYWRELAESIVSQQLSTKAAATITGRLTALGGSTFPSPEQVLALSHDELRQVGLSGAKVSYIQDLAAHIQDGRLRIKDLPDLTNDEIIVELTNVKGIGDWTAHMFLIFSLGRLDVLPVGDLGIRRGIQLLYELDELPHPPHIIKLAAKNGWSGFESIASWYIWRVVDA